MATYSTNQFKNGLKIILDGDPCSITENNVVKPGKGQAFNKIKAKNLRTGRVLERTPARGQQLPVDRDGEPDRSFEIEVLDLTLAGQAHTLA